MPGLRPNREFKSLSVSDKTELRGGIVGPSSKVLDESIIYQLSESDSGKLFLLDSTAGPMTIRLPVARSGLSFRFVKLGGGSQVSIEIGTGSMTTFFGSVVQSNTGPISFTTATDLNILSAAVLGTSADFTGAPNNRYFLQGSGQDGASFNIL